MIGWFNHTVKFSFKIRPETLKLEFRALLLWKRCISSWCTKIIDLLCQHLKTVFCRTGRMTRGARTMFQKTRNWRPELLECLNLCLETKDLLLTLCGTRQLGLADLVPANWVPPIWSQLTGSLRYSLSFRLELFPPRGGVSHADPPSPLVSIISVFFL